PAARDAVPVVISSRFFQTSPPSIRPPTISIEPTPASGPPPAANSSQVSSRMKQSPRVRVWRPSVADGSYGPYSPLVASPPVVVALVTVGEVPVKLFVFVNCGGFPAADGKVIVYTAPARATVTRPHAEMRVNALSASATFCAVALNAS